MKSRKVEEAVHELINIFMEGEPKKDGTPREGMCTLF